MPEGVKRVDVRARGVERIIAPADMSWDSFFLAAEAVSDDFMNDRATQVQTERETL